MEVLTGKSEAAKELCDALGLKHVRRLNLHIAVGEVAVITAEFFPEINNIKQVPAILKKYKLVEIEEPEKKEEQKLL